MTPSQKKAFNPLTDILLREEKEYILVASNFESHNCQFHFKTVIGRRGGKKTLPPEPGFLSRGLSLKDIQETLPEVPVLVEKDGKKRIVAGRIAGRRLTFPNVLVNGQSYEFSWEAVTRAANFGTPLRIS